MNKNILIIGVIIIIVAVGVLIIAQRTHQSPTSYDIQGMKIEILQQGSGVAAKSGDTVTVNYTGTLADGTKFDYRSYEQ